MKAKKKLSQQEVLFKTHYDSMSADERDIFFKSYTFDAKNKEYLLTNENLLTESIIKKIHSDEN